MTQAALKIKRHSLETVIFNFSYPLGPLSCPDHNEGHLNGLSCYYKHRTSKTWENAKEDCTASGSNLVKINGTNKNDTGFLIRLLDTINFKEVAELSRSDQKTGSTINKYGYKKYSICQLLSKAEYDNNNYAYRGGL